MTQFCNPAKKPRVEAMTNETCLPGTLSAIMESDEDREMGKSGDAVESDGGSAEGEKEAPKKPLTEAERVVRGILWGIYRQATRWDRKYDFNANPHSAPESNVFDTHCHIDRLFGPKLYHEWFPYFRKNIVTKSRGAYYAKFEGCITNFCDLDFIEEAPMNRLLSENGIYASIGCHPRGAQNFKESGVEIARRFMSHPKVVAVGEIGLDFSNPGTSGQVGVRMAVFRDFVELALEWKKPLILHVRQATVEAMQIMTETAHKETEDHKASSWLEQIRGRDDDEEDDDDEATVAGCPQKMAVEMNKLMALQSLQNSLQLITMGITATQQQHKNPLERLRDLQQQQQQQQQAETKESLPLPPPPPPPPPPQSPTMIPADRKEDLLPVNNNYLIGLIRGHAQAQAADYSKSNSSERDDSLSASPTLPGGSRSPNLTDIKEEPAAKRTQMWLQQLGRYRQKSLQEEIDKNHDDLWEEQIARAKERSDNNKRRTSTSTSSNSGKKAKISPGGEPETIVLDDDCNNNNNNNNNKSSNSGDSIERSSGSDDSGSRKNAALALTALHAGGFKEVAMSTPAPAAPAAPVVPLMSALQVMKPPLPPPPPPPPQNHKWPAARPPPSATITRPPTAAEEQHRLPPVVYPPNYSLLLLQKNIAKNIVNNENDANANPAAAAVSKKRMTLPLENDLPNPNFARLQDADQEAAVKEGPDKLSFVKEDETVSPVKDVRKEDKPAPASFLKSILLDRMTRKRSFGEDETPYVVKKSSGEETVPKVPRSPKASQMPPPPAEDCNDILRRRLLGLKDPNYDIMQRQLSHKTPQPQHNNGRPNIEVKDTPAEEMKGVDHEEVVQTVEDNIKGVVPSLEDGASFEEDNVRREEDACPPPQVEAVARPTDYSHTSVLKHLLHRYTGGENNEEDDNDKTGA